MHRRVADGVQRHGPRADAGEGPASQRRHRAGGWRRTLDAEGIKATRLTNVKPFVVPVSRIEYQRDQQLLAQTLAQRLGLPLQAQNGKPAYADMRIVLGRDVMQARYLK